MDEEVIGQTRYITLAFLSSQRRIVIHDFKSSQPSARYREPKMLRFGDWVDEEIDVFFYIRRFSGYTGLLEEGCPFVEAVLERVFEDVFVFCCPGVWVFTEEVGLESREADWEE